MVAVYLAFPSSWQRTFGFGRLALSRHKVTSNRSGARNEASGLALRFRLQTCPQTTVATTPIVPFGIGWREAARFGRQVGLDLDFRIASQIAVGFAPQTRPETGVEVAF